MRIAEELGVDAEIVNMIGDPGARGGVEADGWLVEKQN